MPETQQPLFYEDIYDAINKMVNGNPKGLSLKQIAMTIWPTRNPDTARSLFSRAINPESHDHKLDPEELDKTMDETGAPEHIIFYFCDKYGFERPAKKERRSIEKRINNGMKDIQDQMRLLTRLVHQLRESKE